MKTKKSLYILFVLVVVSLLSVTPVLASEACPHPEPTIQALHACVTDAIAMGHIDNRGVANSLLAKLDSAQAALDRGQTQVAAANLHAFIQEVKAQTGKHIAAEHAEHMVMHAQAVIDNLSH